MNDQRNLTFLYFTDPMCSWCYGFGPEIETLAEEFAAEIELQVIPGGLRPYEKNPMPAAMAKEVTGHWHHVQEASGKPFDFEFFERNPDFVYDTAPSSQAVNTVNRIDPAKALDYLHELQKRFYALGEDPTTLDTFIHAAESVGLDGDTFNAVYHEPETEALTRANFQLARDSGVTGYPTVLIHNGERAKLVTMGFQTIDHLRRVVERQADRLSEAA